MPTRSAAIRLVVVGILGVGTVTAPGWAQDPETKPNETNPSAPKKSDRTQVAEREPDFLVWRQKAQLELEVLQAQVEAKKAEILLRNAEFRMKQLAPDLAILTMLDKPISMSFGNETPLEDVLKYIKVATKGPNDNGIPIYIDPEGLQKANKSMTSPVTIDLEGVPLRTTLRLVLKQLGLRYAVKDGILAITADPEQ